MKAVILAGGLGTRLSEETHLKPKPMVDIGGKPILWHIMKYLSCFEINDFIICCGYKGYVIKEYFHNYFLHTSDISISIDHNQVEILQQRTEKWNVTLVDTGEKTMTGGRLRRVKEYLDDEAFIFTYGDGLTDLDINKLVAFHNTQKTLATVTAVFPPARFGALDIKDSKVKTFIEKPTGDNSRINGGYFILSPKVIELITNDACIWEREPLETLAAQNELSAFKHDGNWTAMDTLRDKEHLDNLWSNGNPFWKLW